LPSYKDGDNGVAPDPFLRISSRSFGRLSQLITHDTGIKIPESKVATIQARLQHRVRDLGLESLEEYCEYLFSPSGRAAEQVQFINAITTNKTDFFREPKHFTFLTQTALPQLGRSGLTEPGGRIGVWSAGCSSGEEPYALAMTLSEYGLAHPPFAFRILGTDISTKVLQMGRDGIYPKQQIAPVPLALRRKYLMRGMGEKSSLTRITPALRRTVSFHQLNFMSADYRVRQMFHIIFCRNVMIYFDRPTQESVIDKLCRNLIPGGYLFIGHAESLSGFNLPLIALGSSCFQRCSAVDKV
jgi:chemotaxis protein methyltransferase CheR